MSYKNKTGGRTRMAKHNPRKAQKIRNSIKLWDDNWKYNRDQYHLFTSFVLGEQWTEDESRVFENYRKIPLTFNKLAPLMNHLGGEQRQNTPNLQVQPGKQVDEQAAETREALVKDISLSSDAKVVYQICFQQAGVGGFSAYGIIPEYENEQTFQQVPKFVSFKDPTRCFWDLGAESPAKTDGMYAGFRTRMTRKRFKALYGKKLERMIPTTNDEENTFIAVADDDTITIIDWFERKYQRSKLYLLSNNESVSSEELKLLDTIEVDGQAVLLYDGAPVSVIDCRDTHNFKVIHLKYAGDYELEGGDFPSEQLPIVFVDQNSYWDKKGRQNCRPFVKDAKDAQKYLNYLGTQSGYLLKISRYDQFLVSKSNVKGADTQTIWRDPNTVQGGLIFDESPSGFVPQQLRPPELSQSLITQYDRALMDIQSSTGMYNTQLGEQGNETSGTAIDARTRRGSYNTFVPFDALNRAIAVGGEIINEMIPKIYDTERTLNLNFKDSGMRQVTINKPVDEYSDERQNDMTKGEYKIRLVPGPSYEGQKQEALESMQSVLKANPQLFNLIADMYVENLPLANNVELKNRLRTIVPPEIVQAGKTGQPLPPKPTPPDPKMMELQFKMQQAQQDSQLKMHELQLKEQEIMMKSHQAGVDFSTELQKIELQKNEAQSKLKDQELRYTSEMARIQADTHMGHSNNILKILTHQPDHLKPQQQPSNKDSRDVD